MTIPDGPYDDSDRESHISPPVPPNNDESPPAPQVRLALILRRIPNLALAVAIFLATEAPIEPSGLGGWRHN